MLFIAGALNLAFYSIAQTIVQLEAPMHLRGRLIGLFSMSAFGLRAFSGVTVGVIGGLIGVHWSLALSSLVLLAVTLGFVWLRASSVRRWSSRGEWEFAWQVPSGIDYVPFGNR